MSRIIPVDNNTYIGYNYLIKKYFINNRDTITYRESSTEAKRVLDIVAPDNVITIEILNTLARDLEVLKTLSYTLSDTGAYISTVQLNDYEDYPIELRPDTNKLLIRNTNVVFDLTLNEARNSRITVIQSYYKEHLGLDLTFQQLTLIYNFMINTYNPYVANLIFDTTTTPIYYSNSFACSNYSKRGKLTYECDANPNEEYNYTTIANILNADSSTNTITLTSAIPSSLAIGDVIKVENATTVLDTYTYSADGVYTISSIDTDTNTIKTQEPLQGSYTHTYPEAYLITSELYLTNIDRETSTFTFSNSVPNSIQVGDIIYVTGTQQEVEGETVTCDGEYIVNSISSNTITTQETPPANYDISTGEYPTVTKRLFIGNVNTIEGSTGENIYTITLTNTPKQSLSINAHIVITYNTTETYYTINSITDNILTCLYMDGSLTSYEVIYPLLEIQSPYTNILISITSSSNETIMPTGEFMVDNFEQCKEYIGLLEGTKIPPDSVYANLGTEVGKEDVIIEGLPNLKFMGIYSQVYTSESEIV